MTTVIFDPDPDSDPDPEIEYGRNALSHRTLDPLDPWTLPFLAFRNLHFQIQITPLPQGDVTLEQIKEGLGDTMFLLDGIPAVYFDDTFSVDVLVECTRHLIELFAPKLVLGISDEISSTGDLDRIKVVGQIVDEYNARFG